MLTETCNPNPGELHSETVSEKEQASHTRTSHTSKRWVTEGFSQRHSRTDKEETTERSVLPRGSEEGRTRWNTGILERPPYSA